MLSTPMVRSRLKLLLDQRNISRLQLGQPAQSVRQFALECGLPPSVVSNLYFDRAQRADFKTFDRLCRILHCTPGDILEYTPDAHE